MTNTYHKILKKIAHFQVNHPYFVVLILLSLTLLTYQGVLELRTVASLEQMMPSDIEEIKAFNTLRDNHLGQDMIAIVIEVDENSPDPNGIIDMKDKRVYEYLHYLQNIVDKEPDIIEIYSYANIIDSKIGSEDYSTIISDTSLKPFFSNYISHDSSITMLIATTDVSANDPRMNLLSSKIYDIIDSVGKPPGTKILLTGTPVIQQKLGTLISEDRQNTKWISTLLVFLITMLIFGTFTSAVVPIIIVTLSVNWLYATMGYTGLPISTLAGGVAAMVIGIGIDFSIHIMNKFKYERKKGLSIQESIEEAVVDTGTALTATSLTTVAAFLAFLTGVMPEMGRFGLLMAIGIAYSLFFSLFGLPALLIVEEKIIYWTKDKVTFGLEGELALAEKGSTCPDGYEVLKAKEIRFGQRILVKSSTARQIRFDRRKYRKSKVNKND